MNDLVITDEVRADVAVIRNLNNDRLTLEERLEQYETRSDESDKIVLELEIIQQALASAAIDLLESITGER